jgi:hypothetical protein
VSVGRILIRGVWFKKVARSGTAKTRNRRRFEMHIRVGICTAALLVLSFGVASAQMGLHMTPPAGRSDAIPPNGTVWHEIYPTYCSYYTQHNYFDNGNGIVDSCDYIVLTNSAGHNFRYHIQAMSWTYVTHATKKTPPLPSEYYESPLAPDQNHVGTSWHQVYPPENFCNYHTVDQHLDFDNDGAIDPGEEVILSPAGPMLVDEVGIDIEVGPGTAVEPGTWGSIKGFFGNVF